MKRTNLVLDAPLLEAVRRELETKTYSSTVNLALQEVLRIRKIQKLRESFGKQLWQGDLSLMREDRPAHTRRQRSSPRTSKAR